MCEFFDKRWDICYLCLEADTVYCKGDINNCDMVDEGCILGDFKDVANYSLYNKGEEDE